MFVNVEYHSALYLRRAFTDGNMAYGVSGQRYYAYERPKISNPNTTEQQRSRSAWKVSSAAWMALPGEVKAAWADYAKKRDRDFDHFGQERLSGYRLFQASAGYRQIMDLPIRTAPPVASPPLGLDNLELLPGPLPGTFRFRVTHQLGSGTGYRVIVSMTPATARGSRAPERKYARHIKGWGVQSTCQLPPSGSVIEFRDARFPIAAGRRFGVWVRVVRENDGLARTDKFFDFIRLGMVPDPVPEGPPSEPEPLASEDTARLLDLIDRGLFSFEGMTLGNANPRHGPNIERSSSGWP